MHRNRGKSGNKISSRSNKRNSSANFLISPTHDEQEPAKPTSQLSTSLPELNKCPKELSAMKRKVPPKSKVLPSQKNQQDDIDVIFSGKVNKRKPERSTDDNQLLVSAKACTNNPMEEPTDDGFSDSRGVKKKS